MGFKSGQNQLCAFICNSRNLRGSKCNYVAYYVGTVSTTVEIYRVPNGQIFTIFSILTVRTFFHQHIFLHLTSETKIRDSFYLVYTPSHTENMYLYSTPTNASTQDFLFLHSPHVDIHLQSLICSFSLVFHNAPTLPLLS